MKNIWFVLVLACAGLSAVALAQNDDGSPAPQGADSKRAMTVAKSLCCEYFVKRYQMVGAELKCSVNLDSPETIEGWPGRWRMHGIATLRNYRADPSMEARERELGQDKNLSAKQIRRKIENESLLKSEIVEFEVTVMDLDSNPSADVTIK